MIESHYDKTFTPYTVAAAAAYPYDLAETVGTTFNGCIQQLSGQEVFVNGQIGIIVSHRIYCPYSVSLTEKQTIKYGTQTFSIESIDSVELKTSHHKEILVKEVK